MIKITVSEPFHLVCTYLLIKRNLLSFSLLLLLLLLSSSWMFSCHLTMGQRWVADHVSDVECRLGQISLSKALSLLWTTLQTVWGRVGCYWSWNKHFIVYKLFLWLLYKEWFNQSQTCKSFVNLSCLWPQNIIMGATYKFQWHTLN